MRFREIYQTVQSRAGSDDADLLVIIKREINNGLRDVQRRIPDGYWRRATRVFSTLGEVTDGTVTVTNGDSSVTKAGGSTGTWRNRHQHGYFQKSSDRDWYRVARWVSETNFILEHPYLGATAAGASYKLLKAEYTMPGDFVRLDGIVQIETPERLIPLEQWDVRHRLPDIVNFGHVGKPIAYWFTDPTRVENFSSGTITAMTQGSRTVEGATTLWQQNGMDIAGMTLQLDEENEPYLVDHADSNGELELKEPYLGASFTGAAKPYKLNPPGLQKLHLYPIPDAQVMVRFDYFRRLPALISDDQQPGIPFDYHDVLQLYAEYRVLRHLGMDTESRDAKRDYGERVLELKAEGQDRNSDIIGRLERRPDVYDISYANQPQFRLPGNYEPFGY